MKRLFTAAVIISAIAAPGLFAGSAQIISTDLSGSDLAFFSAAQKISLVAGLSAMARDRAVTPEIKALASSIATEQTAAAAQLKALADRQHLPIGTETDGAGKKEIQTLAKLNGVKFDKTYLDLVGDALAGLEQSLEAGANSANAEVKTAASSTLATVKQERAKLRRLGI